MKKVEVYNKGINSISQMRNALFLPYIKIENTNLYKQFIANERKVVLFENEYYKLEIMDHLLSQVHRDILDVVLNRKLIPLEGDRAYVSFHINSLLKELNLHNGKTDRDWVKQKLEELKRVNIKIISKKDEAKETSLYNICDIARYSEKLEQYLLVLSTDYLRMLSQDILVNYSNYLPHILSIEHGVIKAFVRYVFSHTWVNKTVDSVLLEIEVDPKTMGKRNYQKIKKSIREYDFLIFGISVLNNRVKYKKMDDIYFYNADNEIKKRTNIPVKANQYPRSDEKSELISPYKRTNIPVKRDSS